MLVQESLMNSASDVLGRTVPRLWTPPLRELTPETSFGFDVIDFAEAIGWPLDEWQQWVAIHLGELLPDGRPRFRTVLILVARQNGKTLLCRVLILYWMYIECVKLIVGTNTGRDTAKKSWREVIEMAQDTPMLAEETGPKAVRESIGEESFSNLHGSEYIFAAPNNRAGRSLTVDRALIDEVREHKTWVVWNALTKAMTAVPNGQAVLISNQGEIYSVVLDSLRESAIEYIETGIGDPRTGLFEWSAPNGSDPTDVEALAMANPNLGRRILLDSLMGDAIRAKRSGGEELATFRTEVMCERVTSLNAAIDSEAWERSGSQAPINLAEHRKQVALCLDVSLDATHATLVAAAYLDGKTHVEVIKAWNGRYATQEVRRDLPKLIEKIKPRVLGWFPGGPTAAIAASMQPRRGVDPWPPRSVQLEEIKGETKAVCMGLAEQVRSGEVQHPNDELLTAHIESAQRLKSGDGYVFTRQGTRPIDGAYATAGAVHLARTLPPPLRPLVVATA